MKIILHSLLSLILFLGIPFASAEKLGTTTSNVTERPRIMPTHEHSKMNPDLFAILLSIFGAYSGAPMPSSACGGIAEIACPDYGGDGGGYTPESYANYRTTAPSDLGSPFKILVPFKKYFDPCTAGAGLGSCRFVNLGIKGDASHQQRRSCHNSSQAIDVGPLTCAGGRKVLPSDPRYFEVAKCMANRTNNDLEVIFYKTEGPNMKQKSDHNNHMHIQLKNCSMIYG